MNISDRYRALADEVRSLMTGTADPKIELLLEQAVRELAQHEESVGDIPQLRLENELTPVLLKAHNLLDRARMLFNECGEEDRAASLWEAEQKIYRLLNAL
jgi:hypothetical protein